jgi:predicted permease
MIDALRQDAGYALRSLVKEPGFAAAAALTVALGVGANTAIFSIVNAVLVRALPYPEPDRLMVVTRKYASGEFGGQTSRRFLAFREHLRSFEALGATDGPSGVNLASGGDAEHVRALGVSHEYFPVFGVRPLLGRSFNADDDAAGSADVAVLSHELWARRFGSDPEIVGSGIVLGGRPYTVVGVMPAGFRAMPGADLFVPLRPATNPSGEGFNFNVVGRLADGVTREQAQTELDLIVAGLRRDDPRMFGARETPGLQPFQEQLASSVRTVLLVLMGAVAVLLLIACANTASLVLARASTRGREIAIRAALGAGRGRIVRQLLTEAVVLAAAGGALGILVARWGLEGLAATAPAGLVAGQDVRIDAVVLGVTAILSIGTGLLFGLAPALAASRLDLAEAFKEDGTRAAVGGRAGWIRRALVTVQVASCMVLLVGAALLVRTVVNLRSVELGFDPFNLLTAQMSVNRSTYPGGGEVDQFYARALERIRQLPGVESAAVVSGLPVERGLNLLVHVLDGPAPREDQQTDWRYATPEYFAVMRIPLVSGRALAESDRGGGPPVAVVNERFARVYFDGRHAVGGHIRLFDRQGPPVEIVGVVGNVQEQGLAGAALPTVYVPAAQAPEPILELAHHWFPVSWVIRTRPGSPPSSNAIRDEVRAVDSTQPFSTFRTMDEVIAESIAAERFQAVLLGGFALVALALAAAGLYGVVAYTVAQRTREIGIRMALGATVHDILRSVLGHGVRLAAAGVAVGCVGALALTRFLESVVFGVSTVDPATFTGVALFLLALATVASLIPAVRAARLNPMRTLRSD